MAQTSVLPATPSQSSPRERRPGRLSSERSRAPADWPGPHLERLNAWVERRQRILVEIVQRAEQQQDA
jgi:hypothetical protein